jgi:predicted metal-dependent hydrolase
MSNKNKNIEYFCWVLAIFLLGLIFYVIYKQVENYEKSDDPILHNLKDKFNTFFNGKEKYWTGNLKPLNNRKIMNEINLYKGKKSYTINKENVYLCLKDENGEYYDENLLTYVLAHELAHVICHNIGHTPEFHAIFEQLLLELIDEGLYDPSKGVDPTYCENGDNS